MGNPYEDASGTYGTTLSEAWRQIDQLLTEGQIVLPNGTVIDPREKGSGDYIRAVMGLLHFKPPKKKLTSSFDDYAVQRTDAVPPQAAP